MRRCLILDGNIDLITLFASPTAYRGKAFTQAAWARKEVYDGNRLFHLYPLKLPAESTLAARAATPAYRRPCLNSSYGLIVCRLVPADLNLGVLV